MPGTGLRQLARIITIAAVTVLAGSGIALPANAVGSIQAAPEKNAEVNTADNGNLHTWWHSNGVFNTTGPTADSEVRRS